MSCDTSATLAVFPLEAVNSVDASKLDGPTLAPRSPAYSLPPASEPVLQLRTTWRRRVKKQLVPVIAVAAQGYDAACPDAAGRSHGGEEREPRARHRDVDPSCDIRQSAAVHNIQHVCKISIARLHGMARSARSISASRRARGWAYVRKTRVVYPGAVILT